MLPSDLSLRPSFANKRFQRHLTSSATGSISSSVTFVTAWRNASAAALVIASRRYVMCRSLGAETSGDRPVDDLLDLALAHERVRAGLTTSSSVASPVTLLPEPLDGLRQGNIPIGAWEILAAVEVREWPIGCGDP